MVDGPESYASPLRKSNERPRVITGVLDEGGGGIRGLTFAGSAPKAVGFRACLCESLVLQHHQLTKH